MARIDAEIKDIEFQKVKFYEEPIEEEEEEEEEPPICNRDLPSSVSDIDPPLYQDSVKLRYAAN